MVGKCTLSSPGEIRLPLTCIHCSPSALRILAPVSPTAGYLVHFLKNMSTHITLLPKVLCCSSMRLLSIATILCPFPILYSHCLAEQKNSMFFHEYVEGRKEERERGREGGRDQAQALTEHQFNIIISLKSHESPEKWCELLKNAWWQLQNP